MQKLHHLAVLGLRGSALVLGILIGGTATAEGTYFAIISTARNSPKTTARLNYASAEHNAAQFTVFPPNAVPVFDIIQEDLGLFATSASSSKPEIANLFVGSAASTTIVAVAGVDNFQDVVTLEQSSSDGKVVLDVPPFSQAGGRRFIIPIGDLQNGTSILVGNPNGIGNAFTVRYGENLPGPPVPISIFGTAIADVTQGNTLLVIDAVDVSVPLIVVLAVDTGKTTALTFVTPLD